MRGGGWFFKFKFRGWGCGGGGERERARGKRKEAGERERERKPKANNDNCCPTTAAADAAAAAASAAEKALASFAKRRRNQRTTRTREVLETAPALRRRQPSVFSFVSIATTRLSLLFFSPLFLPLPLSFSFSPCFSHPISSADPNESKRKRAEKIEHVPKRLLSPLPLSLSLSQKTKKKTKEKIRRTRTRSSTPSTAQARPSAGRTRPLPHREGRRPPCLPPRAARWRGAAGRKPERGTERTQGCDEGAASRGRRRTILWARGSPREGWRLPFRGWGSRA